MYEFLRFPKRLLSTEKHVERRWFLFMAYDIRKSVFGIKDNMPEVKGYFKHIHRPFKNRIHTSLSVSLRSPN